MAAAKSSKRRTKSAKANQPAKAKAASRKSPPAPLQAHQGWFSKAACQISHWAGKPISFLMAAAAVIIWGVSGPFFDYSDTWQLVINTSTTIITFLMVFLIQNTQNRDTAAMQVKLAELIIRLQGADNKLATAEDMSDEDLEKLHRAYKQHADDVLASLSERRSET